MRRSLSLLVLCSALVLGGPAALAWAAPPPNDTWAGAIELAIPSTTVADTTEAAVDADEVAVRELCQAPSGAILTNVVWYRFETAEEALVRIATAGSDPSVAGAVVTGSPGSIGRVACFIGSTILETERGMTYFVALAAFDAGRGGTLRLSVDTGKLPTATLELTGGTVMPRDGAVTLTGAITCTPGATASVFGTLRQRLGRSSYAVVGFVDGEPVACDGTWQPWTGTAHAQRWQFRRGPATFDYQLSVSSDFGFMPLPGTVTVRLGR